METRIPDTISLANINAEVDTALDTTIAEQAQGIPPVTPTLREAISYLYMNWRNDSKATSTERNMANDAGTKIAKATQADDGTTYNQGKMGSGA